MNISNQQLDYIFHALSDATRRDILLRIRGETETVSDIASHYDMSMPAITKHLNILERAGLISRRKSGRTRLCSAEPENINNAFEWLEHYQQFWSVQLDNLKDFVEKNIDH